MTLRKRFLVAFMVVASFLLVLGLYTHLQGVVVTYELGDSDELGTALGVGYAFGILSVALGILVGLGARAVVVCAPRTARAVLSGVPLAVLMHWLVSLFRAEIHLVGVCVNTGFILSGVKSELMTV